MKVVYTGPHDEVDVPAADLFGVKRGDTVEVEDRDLAEQLLAQGWAKPGTNAAKEADR